MSKANELTKKISQAKAFDEGKIDTDIEKIVKKTNLQDVVIVLAAIAKKNGDAAKKLGDDDRSKSYYADAKILNNIGLEN